jgi:hypothetical protein
VGAAWLAKTLAACFHLSSCNCVVLHQIDLYGFTAPAALLLHVYVYAFRYLLQPPSPRGSPFIITNKTITELHLALARRAGHYKVRVPTGGRFVAQHISQHNAAVRTV